MEPPISWWFKFNFDPLTLINGLLIYWSDYKPELNLGRTLPIIGSALYLDFKVYIIIWLFPKKAKYRAGHRDFRSIRKVIVIWMFSLVRTNTWILRGKRGITGKRSEMDNAQNYVMLKDNQERIFYFCPPKAGSILIGLDWTSHRCWLLEFLQPPINEVAEGACRPFSVASSHLLTQQVLRLLLRSLLRSLLRNASPLCKCRSLQELGFGSRTQIAPLRNPRTLLASDPPLKARASFLGRQSLFCCALLLRCRGWFRSAPRDRKQLGRPHGGCCGS